MDLVWESHGRVSDADRRDICRIALRAAGIGMSLPKNFKGQFETQLLELLLPERLRPTQKDRMCAPEPRGAAADSSRVE